MHSRTRNLMFLLGMAPLSVGCNGGKSDGEDGTDTGTGETGSTDASGDGSTVSGSTDAGSDSADAGTGATTTTDDGGSDDGGSTTSDLCEAYGAHYVECYGPYYYENYAQQWCEYAQDWYQQYGPECLLAWEATIECRTAAECYNQYDACVAEQWAQYQACYYDVYNGCDMLGQMVGGCISPGAGEDAEAECDETYANLYYAHGDYCGDAFLQMMVCISQLECQALSDKEYVFQNCGPEIQAKNIACQ
jgi:hypothetical protein